jgi:uncharacterized membrane protein
MNQQDVELVHGFVDKPKAGRWIFICALILVVHTLIMPMILAQTGPDYVQRLNDRGDVSSSPIALGGLNVIIVTILVLFHAALVKGWMRAIFAFIVLLLVGFVAEGVGVHYGWVYGPYNYSNVMGGRIWGVPYIVPVSWELNIYPAFYLALYLLPSELMSKSKTFIQKFGAIFLIASVGAFFCTMTDLLADPVYVSYGEWNWHLPGDYASYVDGGVPFINFVGWYLTALVAGILYMYILESTPKEKHTRSPYIDIYIPFALYLVPFVYYIEMAIYFLHHSDLVLVGSLTMGNVLLMVLAKIYLTKNGYGEHLQAVKMTKKSVGHLKSAG